MIVLHVTVSAFLKVVEMTTTDFS